MAVIKFAYGDGRGGNMGRGDVIIGVEKVAVPATSHSGHF